MTRPEKQAFITRHRPSFTSAFLDTLSQESLDAYFDAISESMDAKSELVGMQMERKRLDAWAHGFGKATQARADAVEDPLEAAEHKRLNAWRMGRDRVDAFDPSRPLTPAGLVHAKHKYLLDQAGSTEARARLAQSLIDGMADADAEQSEEQRRCEAETKAEYEASLAAGRGKARASAIPAETDRSDSFDAQLRAIEAKRQNQWRTAPGFDLNI